MRPPNKSFLTNPKSLQRLLTQLGEPTEVQGKVVRRHFGEHARQVGMFD